MSARGTGAAGAALTVVGGLALAGATTAAWVQQTVTRTIGDAEVTETVVTRGVEFTRVALPLGIAVAAAGILLAALAPGPRRALGALVGAVAVVALVDVALGIAAVSGADGAATSGSGFAAAGAAAVLGGAALSARTRRPAGLPSRFDIDTDAGDDEWSAAVDPDEGEP